MKYIESVLIKACMLAFSFVGVCQSLSANKLELADNGVIIYGVGSQLSDSVTFRADNGQTIPETIQIEELALTYNGAGEKAQILTILNINNDTIFSSNCRNGITPGEFAKGVRFYIKTNEEYTFSHGDKKWKLKFASDPVVEEKTSKTDVSKDLSSQDTNKSKTEVISWWQKMLIVLGFVAIVALLVLCYKKGVFNPKKQEEVPSIKNLTESDPVNPPVDIPTGVNGSVEEDTSDIAKHEVLDYFLGSEHKDLTIDEKIDKIKQQLSSGEKDKRGLNELKHELGLGEDSAVSEMVEKVRSLVKTECKPTKERDNNEGEAICMNLIDQILGKKDKILSDAIVKAQEDCFKGEDRNFNALIKFIDILRIKLNKPEPVNISALLSEITDKQINSQELRPKIKKWLIAQLRDRGVKVLNQSDTPEATLDKIADLLNCASSESPEPSKIVDDAIYNDQLTLEHKNILLSRLICKINTRINDSSSEIDSQISMSDFIDKISEKLQTPSTKEEAENLDRANILRAVNDILQSDITDFDKKSLADAFESAIVKRLNKKLNGFDAQSYDDAMSKLKSCVSNSYAIAKIQKDCGASDIKELPKVIKEKQSSELLKSVDKDVKELLPDKHLDTLPTLVKALIKLAKKEKDSKERIMGSLEESISMRNSEYVSSDDKDVDKLFDEYNNLVTAKERELGDEISNKSDKIKELEKSISQKEGEISTLSERNSNLMSESKVLVENLYRGAEKIMDNCKTILNPCSDSDESQCEDIENRLFEELKKTVDGFRSFSVADDVKPQKARERIQKLLVDELSRENNPINTVCRYYAYSRLPFMTDTSREYGITFRRKNMSDLFHAVQTIYVQFGINLNIPDLFVAGYEEGNFENLTGKAYGDLDNLCHNSRNHLDNIDSNAKPENVIVDVVNVGYTVDGKEERITSVLTF